MGVNSEPKGSKREPKENQRAPRGEQRVPNGSQRTPKGSQVMTKTGQNIDAGEKRQEGATSIKNTYFGVFLVIRDRIKCENVVGFMLFRKTFLFEQNGFERG